MEIRFQREQLPADGLIEVSGEFLGEGVPQGALLLQFQNLPEPDGYRSSVARAAPREQVRVPLLIDRRQMLVEVLRLEQHTVGQAIEECIAEVEEEVVPLLPP